MNKPSNLSSLPAIDEILRWPAIEAIAPMCARNQLVSWVRAAVDGCRQRLLDGESMEDLESTICGLVQDQLRRDQSLSMQHVINATGVLLHTNLGRAPLAQAAIDRMHQVARYTNLESDLEQGRRSRRGARAMELLCQLTGAEAAIAVNNCAAATVLVLQTVAAEKEVLVSRGQLVEIGGGFRLPEVFVSAGVTLREVGTTNRTYLSDYANAMSDLTGAIIRVHRSNFFQAGFVTEPSIEELVALPRSHGIPVIDDLGSGCVVDLAKFGINEPTVQASIAAGADLSLFSGDKLFGGPQCGIIVGREEWISRLRSNPLMRALRLDKITLATLEATTEIHLRGQAIEQIPIYQMLARPVERIEQNSHQLLEMIGAPSSAEVVSCTAQVGGGSLPSVELPSFGLRIKASSVEQLAARLRLSSPAVQCRLAEDHLLLDLRTVLEPEIAPLAECLRKALSAEQAEANGP